MNDLRFCKRCGRKLEQRKDEPPRKFKKRITCGRTCESNIPSRPDLRKVKPKPVESKPKINKKGLSPTLVTIAIEYPELAEAIYEILTEPKTSQQKDWYFTP